jgi:hypothetical protein
LKSARDRVVDTTFSSFSPCAFLGKQNIII